MHKRGGFIPVFFFFLLLSGIFSALYATPLGSRSVGFLEAILSPLQHGVISVFAENKTESSLVSQLQEENAKLKSEVTKYQEQAKEIHALRDQFLTTSPTPRSLLPAKIVGMRAFLPGYSLPEQIVIDKGQKDGVEVDSIVVYKDNLVGKVTRSTDHLALIDLSFRKGFSITATIPQTGALGVIKGMGQGELLLDNVVLSDQIVKDAEVSTNGSTELDGTGSPPGLILGKVVSIDKKPSALFQTAKVQFPLDIRKIDTVFILIRNN